MSENPEDWRSAVDASSGRTYWYHRKTRVSTWIRPDFAEPTPVEPQHLQATLDEFTSKEQEFVKVQRNLPVAVNKESLAVSSFRRTLKKIAQNPQQAQNTDLKYLLEAVGQHTLQEEEAGEVISELVHVSILSQDGFGTRHIALRCLFALAGAEQHEYAARFFHVHQAWTSLAAYTPTWKRKQLATSASDGSNDPESILLVAALYCYLLIGPTFYSISAESKDCLVELLDTTFIQSTDSIVDFDVLLGKRASPGVNEEPQNSAVLSEQTVQTYTLLAEKGHSLPAVWLLAVFTQSLRSEKLFVQMVQLGFLQAMKAMCMSSKLDADLKATARECLLSAMASSAYVRERVLDSLVDLSAALSPVPAPMGPEPILYCGGAPLTSEQEDEEEGTAAEEQAEDSEGPVLSRAQAKYKHIAAGGFCDVPLGNDGASEGPQPDDDSAWNTFNRDVEWIPRSGTPWRLSSSLLWARCPALRELINSFWDEGGGGLELSIEACDEVLASLCRYIHTGLLVLPIALHRQLELLRVSSELGMTALHLSVKDALQQKMSMESVANVIAFCAEHQFADLERTCRAFLTSGGRRTAVIRFQPSGEQNPQNAYLRDAIFASLQDVNTVLNQHPPSQTKLKVEAPSTRTAPGSARSAGLSIPHRGNTVAAELAAPSLPQQGRDHRQLELDEDLSNMDMDDSYDLLTSASLLDIAAGRGTGLSRENSYSNEANTFHSNMNYRDESAGSFPPGKGSQAVEYTGSSSGLAGNNKSGKPRGGSGGIYGLLLQGSGSGPAEEFRHPAVAVPTKPTNVPGKIGTEKRPGPAVANPKSKLALAVSKEKERTSAAKAGAPAAARPGSARPGTAPQTRPGDASDGTPRTQRASSLLATARPSASAYVEEDTEDRAYRGFSADDYDEDDDRNYGYGYGGSDFPIGEEEDWQGDASFVDSDEVNQGPQEFSTQMSLKPQRDKTPNEKRIERLTRPTKVLGVADKNAKKRDSAAGEDNDAEAEGDDGTVPEARRSEGSHMPRAPAAATSPIAVGVPKAKANPAASAATTPAASSSSSSAVTASASVSAMPEGLARLKAGAASGKPPQRPGEVAGLVALKRSVSPATSHSSSKDGHLLSIGSSSAVDSSGPYSPPPRSASSELNVRGSLTLLKTKTAGSRRRRSVADIEGAQDAPPAAAAEEQAPPVANSNQNRSLAASAAANQASARRNPAHISLDLTQFGAEGGEEEVGHEDHDQEEEPNFEQTDEFADPGGPKMSCPTCARMFNPQPYEKHVKICAKVFVGKRKVFDSAKMRVEGNPDLKEFVEAEGKGSKKRGKPGLERKTSSGKEMTAAATAKAAAASAAQSKWKEQSDAFRAAMKSARDVSIAIATGAPLPPPPVSAPDSSLVQCPHCQRRFSANAAERHIPVCQNIRAKPAALKRGGGGNASSGSATGGVSSAVKGRNWQ